MAATDVLDWAFVVFLIVMMFGLIVSLIAAFIAIWRL